MKPMTADEVERVLKAHGFRLVKIDFIGFLWD